MAKPKSAKTDRKQSEEDLCRHSKEQFNLIDEHWIPVVWKPDAQGLFGHTDIDARPPEIGLRDTLLHSHEIAEIADQSPLVTAALHRLLTALVHAIFGYGKNTAIGSRCGRPGYLTLLRCMDTSSSG